MFGHPEKKGRTVPRPLCEAACLLHQGGDLPPESRLEKRPPQNHLVDLLKLGQGEFLRQQMEGQRGKSSLYLLDRKSVV